MVDQMENPRGEVSIGLVGKYVEYEDSYKSLKEALIHGALAHGLKLKIHWIDVHPDYTTRTEPEEIFAALDALEGRS